MGIRVGSWRTTIRQRRPSTKERFDAEQHRTFEGTALAIVRPTGPGKIRVVAIAAGCDPAEVVVTVEPEHA